MRTIHPTWIMSVDGSKERLPARGGCEPRSRLLSTLDKLATFRQPLVAETETI
jgi:hypothetical protein